MVDRTLIRWEETFKLPSQAIVTYAREGRLKGYIPNERNNHRLEFNVFPTYFTITLNFGKWLRDENFTPVSLLDIQTVVSEIAEILGVDAYLGRIMSYEWGQCFIVNHPPAEYMRHWGPMNHCPLEWERRENGNVLFTNTLRSLQGYDKTLWALKSGEFIPPEFQGKNVIRLEEKEKRPTMTPEGLPLMLDDLTEESTFLRLTARLVAFYEDIVKTGTPRLLLTGCKNEDDPFLKADSILRYGLAEYCQLIMANRKLSRSAKSRRVKEVKTLAQDARYTIPDELNKELEIKIRDALRSSR